MEDLLPVDGETAEAMGGSVRAGRALMGRTLTGYRPRPGVARRGYRSPGLELAQGSSGGPVRPGDARRYGVAPRNDAGWPGSFRLPTLASFPPLTCRTVRSRSRKLPT